MRHLVAATRAAVRQGNWYAALAMALALPDICGWMEAPQLGSQARFVAWYERFLLKRYQMNVAPYGELHTFLGGRDCYALRCAFLHQGEFGIDDQRARNVLERFHFTAPRPNQSIHMNQIGLTTLQLQVDEFCADVCKGVDEWLVEVHADPAIQGRIAQLPTIE